MPCQPQNHPSPAKAAELSACYLAGVEAGLRAFAHWKDGVQYVGIGGTTLAEALMLAKKGEFDHFTLWRKEK